MNAQETLRAARERGLTLKAAGDKLRIAPAQAVDDVLRAALVAHKLAILRMLTNPRAEHPSSPEEEIQPLSTKQEAARREVLAQLAANPTVQRALCNRFENGALIITLAIRGTVDTCRAIQSRKARRLRRPSGVLGCSGHATFIAGIAND
jgi:hypothetical protein